MNITPFHAKYFAFELTKRSPSNNIQKFAATLLDAQVDLNPQQVEAALFIFRSTLSNGAILTVEVYQRKEDLISGIEKRLKQNLVVNKLFIIKWELI